MSLVLAAFILKVVLLLPRNINKKEWIQLADKNEVSPRSLLSREQVVEFQDCIIDNITKMVAVYYGDLPNTKEMKNAKLCFQCMCYNSSDFMQCTSLIKERKHKNDLNLNSHYKNRPMSSFSVGSHNHHINYIHIISLYVVLKIQKQTMISIG